MKEEARHVVRDLAPWPLLPSVLENGHSPLDTVVEAREIGSRTMISSFGALVPPCLVIEGAFERLKTEAVTGVYETGIGPKCYFGPYGLEEAVKIDEIAGGDDF